MSDKLIPADARRAAARGFIRTTSQALATTIPVSGLTGAVLSDMDWTVVVLAVVAAILSAVLAGLVSFFSLLSRGIPEDYMPDLPPREADAEPDHGTHGYVSGV